MRYCLSIAVLLLLAACGATPQATTTGATSVPVPTTAAIATAAPAATAETLPAAASATAQQETTMPKPSPSTVLPDRTTRPAPTVAIVPTVANGAGVTGEVPQDLLDKILADAAQRSGVNAAQIVVQVGEAVEWPDSSLGCAKPGVMYMQVVTPGYKVVLQAGSTTYDYRADGSGFFLLCE